METGSRSDIVRKEGFRLTSFLRAASDQSRYSVESALAQKRRSSSSLVNSGSLFFFIFFINLIFLAVHIANRNHANPVASNREDHEQTPSLASLAEGVVSLLDFRVPQII